MRRSDFISLRNHRSHQINKKTWPNYKISEWVLALCSLFFSSSKPALRRAWAFCRLPLQPTGPPALPTRLPGPFSHCWEEQDAATAAGSKLSTSTSLKKSSHSYTDATTSSESHRLRPDRGSLLGITWQEDLVEQNGSNIYSCFSSLTRAFSCA